MTNNCERFHVGGAGAGIWTCEACGQVWHGVGPTPECKGRVAGFPPEPALRPAPPLPSPYPCDCATKNDGIIKYSCQHCSDATAPVRTKLVVPSDEPTRQATGMRFDLIPGDVMAEVARVFAEGAVKYGDHNWEKGRMIGDKDPINHALKHINLYNAGVPDDEDPDGEDMELHLRHAIVNLMFELHYQLNQDKYGNRFE